MRELAKSFASFSWTLPLFGAQQALRLLAPDGDADPARRAAAGFEAVAWQARQQLGDLLGEVFLAGDALERDAVDLTAEMFPERLTSPAGWMAAGARLATRSGETLELYVPTEGGFLAWRELANKLEVYLLVKRVSRLIGVPPEGEPLPPRLLAQLVDRSYALGDFPSLWAVEGLGHELGRHALAATPEPTGLLKGEAARGLPPGSFLMLHAGIGLAFAQELLAEVPPQASDGEMEGVVGRIVHLCRASSRSGYAGAAYESLGLVTRTFHPQRVAAVARALRAVAPELVGTFWHGVGRALYFLPVNFAPLGEVSWRPFEMGRREAPDAEALDNILAGLGWAFTLVSMRQPEILARRLLARHGRELACTDAFASGVVSSILMRFDTTPEAPLIESFLGYRPPAGSAGEGYWEQLVRRPARAALERTYPTLRREGRLGEIFRYQPLAALTGEARGPAGHGGG